MSIEQSGQRILEISDFRLFTIAYEFRYEQAYALWDEAGAIWSAFVVNHPNAKNVKADPGQTLFRVGTKWEFNLFINVH